MKNRELIKLLEAHDPDSDVLCSIEDEAFLKKDEHFQIFEIVSVESANAEKHRDQSDKPTLKYVESEASETHLLIEITSIF